MAAKYWIKLYHEILDDPKMGRLPDRLWRRTIEMFLLAGEMDQEDGFLPAVTDMSWRLRLTDAELEQDLAELERIGLLTCCQNGTWTVTNFSRRQAASTSTERSLQHRKRMRTQSPGTLQERSRDEDATIRPTDIDTDKDSDSEPESLPPAPPPQRARHLNGHGKQEEADIPGLSTELSTGLQAAGVFREIWPEIAASGRPERELLALLAWSHDSGSQRPAALFVSRFRSGADPPPKYFEPPLECCGGRGEHAETCRRRYISGSAAEFINH